MNSNPRLTKQGLRDLNNFGPKASKAGVPELKPAIEGETKVAPPVSEKAPDAPLPVAGQA